MKKQLNWYFRWQCNELIRENLWQMLLALAFIMSAVFALTVLSLRFEQLIKEQTSNALTADLVLHSSVERSAELSQLASTANLQFSQQTQINTMAFAKEEMLLVSIKGVDSAYPLKGKFLLSKGNNQEGIEQTKVNKGEVFLEPSLLERLNLTVGDTLSLGDADFIVSGEIRHNPELSTGIFSSQPAVFMDINDIEKTGALQPGARIHYHYYFVGDEKALTQLKDTLSISPSERWEDGKTPSRLTEMTGKANQYITMILVFVVLMSAATIIVSNQYFYERKVARLQILNYLGMTKKGMFLLLFAQLATVFVFALGLALILGFLLEKGLIYFLGQLLAEGVGSINYFYPTFIAFTSGFLIVLPIWSETLWQLFKTLSPVNSAQNRKQHQKNQTKMTVLRWFLILLPVTLLLISFGTNLLLWLTSLGVIASFFGLGLFSFVIIYLSERYFKKRQLSVAFRLALSHLKQHPWMALTQLGALGLSLLLLSSLVLVRKDLLEQWQQWIPNEAPNVFALGIPQADKDRYQSLLDEENLLHSPLYPIIRGRITHLNGNYLDPEAEYNGEKVNALSREVNFTWRDSLPTDNQVLSGAFSSNGVSVEEGIAERLNIKLGDTLTFRMNAEDITATVNSIRTVEWRNLTPNFFFIFTPDLLAEIPASYLVSFRLIEETPQHEKAFSRIAKAFPSVVLLDLRQLVNEAQTRLTQLNNALSLLAFLAILSGILLIFTLLQQGLLQRRKQLRLYRLLGASKQQLKHTLYYEYGVMASIASVVAIIFSEIIMLLIQTKFLESSAVLHPLMWLLLPLLTLTLLFLAIGSTLRRVVRTIY